MRAVLCASALVPILGAVAPEAAPPVNNTPQQPMPVAISQPLAAMEGGTLVAMPPSSTSTAMLTEPGMMILVGWALMGLAAVVRRTTSNS